MVPTTRQYKDKLAFINRLSTNTYHTHLNVYPFTQKKKTISSPIGAWEAKLEIMTDQPTDRPTDSWTVGEV